MKAARLDQILIRLGFVTEAHISQALMRQKARGGRLGSHLLYYRYVTETQLTEALSQQHEVAAFDPDKHEIDLETVRQLPAQDASDLQLFPVQYDRSSSTLYLVTADPTATQAIALVKRCYGAARVELLIAPESVIEQLISEHHHGRALPPEATEIELPELFEDAEEYEAQRARDLAAKGVAEDPGTDVLMISKSAAVRNFLGPVFQRDGYRLQVIAGHEELEVALKVTPFSHVLVAADMADEFNTWQREGRMQNLHAQVSMFHSVSQSLLDNPSPYGRIVRSLMRSVQLIAEMRSVDAEWSPPYTPICRDIRLLADHFGLRRLVTDGLQIAAHLLVPSSDAIGWTRDLGTLPIEGFGVTIEHARTIHFPFRIDKVLIRLSNLYTGEATPADAMKKSGEIGLCAQILAVVWYRHVVLRGEHGPEEDVAAEIKSRMREQAGNLALLEVIEVYLRALEDADDPLDVGECHQILIAARTDDLSRQLSSRFGRSGCRTVWTDDLGEARELCERHSPTALLIDYSSFKDEMNRFSRIVKLDPDVLLYVLVPQADPNLALDLLDAGVDDVLSPPHDFDIIAARITRSVRGLSRRRAPSPPGGFNASFAAFSFIDLVQSLAQSLKSVRIDLRSGSGEEGVIFMERGRVVYAACGGRLGEDAAYRVIAWEDDGSFAVVPCSEFPETNVADSNEGILMEGCRLLDESRV